MNDDSILARITDLVDREHELRSGAKDPQAEHDELKALEVELDQCWDLLRQRRAKREFGSDPEEAESRSSGVVETYLQ